MLIVYLYFFRTFEQPQMFLNILDCHFCTLLHVPSACLLSLYWNYSTCSTHIIPDFVSISEWFTIQYKQVNQVRTPNGPSKEFNRHACVPATTSKHQQWHNLDALYREQESCTWLPHGNQKQNKENVYTQTCPSVIQNLNTECVECLRVIFIFAFRKKFEQHSTTLIMSLPMWSV